MAYTEILTGASVTAEQFDDQLFEEYIRSAWFSFLMGSKDTAPIHVMEDLMKKPGDAITLNLRGQLQGGKVTGNAKGIGNEGRFDFFGQRITIDNVRWICKIDDLPMTQKRVTFDVLQAAKTGLADASKIGLDDDVISQLADTTTARVRGRYLYGAADSNWNATHATALTAVDNSSDQLTTNMIDIAKLKAKIPIVATAKIRPMKVMTGKNFQETFIFVAHSYAIRDMVLNDAAWKNAQLNLPPQSNSDSPLYTGSSFKGNWNGTLIYEYEAIPLVSSTIQVAHNFFLGAQACGVVWGQRSKFGEEFSDLGHAVSYETHEIRGVQKLYFDRAIPEDNGIVHVFSAAVA